MLVQRICRRCQRTFETPAYRLKTGRGLYCSRACLTYQVERTCPTCDQTFVAKRCEVERGWGRWCSVPCRWPRATAEELLWRRVVKTGCCWLWFGQSQGKSGYGKLKVGGNKGQTFLAHRLAYELTYGPIPEGAWVLHNCDVRLCVRPDHLRLGISLDNILDQMERRGHPPCCAPEITWA